MARKWTEKRKTLKKYDTTAASYDAQYMMEQRNKFDVTLNHIELNSKSVVLDVGCGTGLLAERIANYARFIVCVDFSSSMLDKAKNRLKPFKNIAIICADADTLPFHSNIFTNVFAITVLQNMPNPTDTLNEITRVAKTNALMIVSGLKKNFTLSSFKMTLADSNLKQITIDSGENIKDHVAACRKANHSTLKNQDFPRYN